MRDLDDLGGLPHERHEDVEEGEDENLEKNDAPIERSSVCDDASQFGGLASSEAATYERGDRSGCSDAEEHEWDGEVARERDGSQRNVAESRDHECVGEIDEHGAGL